MKKKKLALIIAISVAGNYFAPISSTVISYADQLSTKTIQASPLEKNDIDFYNIWGGNSVKLEFNTDTMKMEATRESGDLGNGNNTYMQLFLYNSKENKVEINQEVKDGSSSNLADLLNSKSFNYGDIIGIDFEEGTNAPNIENKGTIQVNEMVYYKITINGLEKYTPNVKANPFSVLTGNKVTEGNITGVGKANSQVTASINGQTFTGKTNAEGNFSIQITDNNGFNQNTKISLEIPSEIGMIKKEVNPVLSTNVSIEKSNIQIINGWGTPAGTIEFNPLTMQMEVSGYNAYLGRNGNDFLNISVYNPATGQIVYNGNINGNENTSALSNLLNGKEFNYGDVIAISHDSSQGRVFIKNGTSTISNNNNGTSYFEITEKGLVQNGIKPIEINPLAILGNGNPNLSTTNVTGKGNPNTEVTVVVNGKTFTGMSNGKGDYSIKVDSTTPFTEQTSILVYSKGLGMATISPIESNGVVIQSSNIQITNGWGSQAGNISFNPITMKMKVSEYNAYLGHTGNNFLNISIYNPATGKIVYNGNFDGDNNTSALSNLLNGKEFNYGDVIAISHDSSQGRVSINNGTSTISNNNNGTSYFEITEKGLVQNGIKPIEINPLAILGNGNPNLSTTNVTGKGNPNTEVTVVVNGKTFTGMSNGKGDYSIKVDSATPFTEQTSILVYSKGLGMAAIKPTENKNVAIQSSNIQIINGWGTPAGSISFNPLTMKMGVSQYNAYLGHNNNNFLNISIYNPSTGKIVYSGNFNGNDNTSVLSNLLNGKEFNYGDVIAISHDGGQGSVSISNGNKVISNDNNGISYFEITEGGLTQNEIKPIEVNPLAILGEGNPDLSTATITGKGNPNTKVSAQVDGKVFTTTSNEEGDFSINIKTETPLSENTNILVYSKGLNVSRVPVEVNRSIYMQDSSINIFEQNGWNPANITFNPITMKMNVQQQLDTLGSAQGHLFNIEIYNPNTKEMLYSGSFNANENVSDLINLLNNKKFSYGDVLGISYNSNLGNVHVTNEPINIFNTKLNTSDYQYFTLSKKGFTPFKQNLIVNPFDVLNGSNPTEGTLTGKTVPNQIVNVLVDGKTYEAKANSNGKFSLSIVDKDIFNSNVKIEVLTDGCVPVIITPTAPTNLEIGQENIDLPDSSLGTAQNISFNPTTMTINEYGNSFLAELINPANGQVISSIGNSNFSVFNSKNNLNGASFKYGDIITMYEPEESYLSDGEIELRSSQSKNATTTDVNAVGTFKSYTIEPQGLVPVTNANLTNITAEYVGNSKINITGKAEANSNVTIYYGSSLNMSKNVKADSNGKFTLQLPIADAQLGTQVEAYVNKDNIQSTLVTYDSKKYNASNSIQIINNANFPVIGIQFDYINNEIQANVNQYYKTYAGVFYGNKMNISLLSKNGKVIKSITSSNPGEIQSFANELNNLKFTDGDILKVQYDKNYVQADIMQDSKEIGNTTGAAEYFEITNKGLVNLTEKFVNINPLNIITENKVTEATLTGKAGNDENVIVNVDGNTFIGKTDTEGNYSINITDTKGFTLNTNITVSANGYLQSSINPSYSNNIGLQNSSINCYINGYTFEMSNIASKIGFNVENQTFSVHNYTNSLGNGESSLFNISLYNQNGQQIYKDEFNNGSTNAISEALNGKKYAYGDIIGLSFNSTIYKPVVLNGTNVIGNVNGEMEYFEITPKGLVNVNFGEKANTANVIWNNGNLQIEANLGQGNSKEFLDASKNIVLVNSNNEVIASEKMTASKNGQVIEGILSKEDLQKIEEGNKYNIEIQIDGKLVPLTINSSTPSFGKYVLLGNSSNELMINLRGKQYVTLANKNEIGTYANTLNKNIQKINSQNVNFNTNIDAKNSVIASEFINRVGLQNLENFYGASSQNAAFLNWVLNNTSAMEEFLGGPNPEGPYVPEGQPAATYTQCLQVWSNIWNTYTNSHYGFNLKLAIAVALTNGQPIMSFPAGVSVGNPVQRYNIFQTLNAEGGMLPEFKTLNVSHLCYVTNTDIANDQIIDMRNILLQNHNGLIGEGSLHNAAYTINYNTRNPYTGASVFGNNFYGPNPNVYSIWYAGGVCGATGRMGAATEQVFGVPANQTPQTGHNAFIWYDVLNNQWEIGNAVDGWSTTYDADMSSWSDKISPNNNVASYNVLYQEADNKTLAESNMYKYLASNQSSYEGKLHDLQKAIEVNSLNLGAWIDLVNLEKNNDSMTITQYNELVNKIIQTFNAYPMPMYDLLLQLQSTYMTKGTQEDFNNYVTTISNTLNNEVNENLPQSQSSVASYLLNQMKANGLYVGNNEISNSSITINNVWNCNVADIGFNPQNNTITVAQGGSATNPYGSSEAFSISLENSTGKVLKQVIVNQCNYSASQEIFNALNGVKFEYGDKLVINYVTSSLITMNDIVLENGQKGNLSLKQWTPKVETLYITKHGLSINSIVKTDSGSTVKKNTANSKDINSTTSKSSSSNTKTDKSSSKKTNTNSQMEMAKKALLEAVSIGKAKLASKEYTKESNIELQKMLTIAENIKNNSSSTVSEVQEITKLLDNVMNELIKSPIIQEENLLKVEIKNAQNIINKANQNGDFGYTKISSSLLKNAINVGSKLLINPNVTEEELNEAVNNIKQEVTSLKNNLEPLGNAIKEGNSKLISKIAYTSKSKEKLEGAISVGDKIMNNKVATLSQVKDATENIENAIKGLEVIKSEKNSQTKPYIIEFTKALNKVVAILENTKESESYTKESIEVLQQRLVLGNYIIENNYQEEQTIEATNLINYTLGIIKKRPEINTLVNAIDNGQSKLKDSSKYTSKSIGSLNRDIVNGEKVVANNNATQQEINNATQNIENGVNSLDNKSNSILGSIWNYITSLF